MRTGWEQSRTIVKLNEPPDTYGVRIVCSYLGRVSCELTEVDGGSSVQTHINRLLSIWEAPESIIVSDKETLGPLQNILVRGIDVVGAPERCRKRVRLLKGRGA